ncbi:MAG: hypothetical protein JNL28_03325 [Planctomycetes bacterium]|nr:hypothetical protein [Planctomycetota bacterium]
MLPRNSVRGTPAWISRREGLQCHPLAFVVLAFVVLAPLVLAPFVLALLVLALLVLAPFVLAPFVHAPFVHALGELLGGGQGSFGQVEHGASPAAGMSSCVKNVGRAAD